MICSNLTLNLSQDISSGKNDIVYRKRDDISQYLFTLKVNILHISQWKLSLVDFSKYIVHL